LTNTCVCLEILTEGYTNQIMIGLLTAVLNQV